MGAGRELEFKGIGVSCGIAVGPALWMGAGEPTVPEYAIQQGDVAREIQRLEKALLVTREQLDGIRRRVGEGMGSESARIFEAHLHVVDDPEFIGEVCGAISRQFRNAEKMVSEVSERYARTLARMEDDYLRERAVDIRDVARRILRNLSGGTGDPLAGLDAPRVLMAREWAPSELAVLDPGKVLALVMELGGPGAHSAIMARAMGLPAVAGISGLDGQIADGTEVVVDGTRGILLARPTRAHKAGYARAAAAREALWKRLEVLRDEPAVTADGRSIELAANIERLDDIARVRENGAKGVGLFRSEFLYMTAWDAPDEGRQTAAYGAVAVALASENVIIRTLDLGGDKLPASIRLPVEANPFLGWRAIRLCLDRPDLFKTQLRAILRASALNPRLKLMYPMVNSAADVRAANAVLEECKAELTAAELPFNPNLETGVMIEIPSAALTAGQIAPLVDFFSIGTNDLAQYTLAVDRGNERVAHLYEPAHPAVLALIRQTVEAGKQHGIWTGVCGEMAGNPLLVPLLVGLGVDELSVSPPVVPLIKEVIRSVTFADAKALAEEALGLPDTPAILDRCRNLIAAVAPDILAWMD